ncbi:plasmid fertility inhibition factor family protein [Ralstonia pseudosolanacearum]
MTTIAPPGLQTFERLAWIHHARRAVFRVETATQGSVYMSMHASQVYAVVEVDAVRLLALWRHPQTRLAELAFGDASSWPQDRKYPAVGPCFAEGASNPVPLAEVSCYPRREPRGAWVPWRPRVAPAAERAVFDFGDGTTRTIWLLTNGARVFPVSCEVDQAPLLLELAGAAGGRHCRADALVRPYRSDEERFAELEASNAMVLQAIEERERRRRV